MSESVEHRPLQQTVDDFPGVDKERIYIKNIHATFNADGTVDMTYELAVKDEERT